MKLISVVWVVVLLFVSGCSVTEVGQGFDLVHDHKAVEAIPHLEKAVDQGDKGAAVLLAFIYLCDCDVPLNLTKARVYYQKAITLKGQPYDEFLDYYTPLVKAEIMLYDDDPRNDSAAVTILRGDRYKDYWPALETLALSYACGCGVKRSDTIAKMLFRRSIQKEPVWGANDNPEFFYAWWLAVFPDPSFRDGPLALSLLKPLDIDEDDPRRASKLDTLAAVYAANGDFAKAISTQNLAIKQLKKNMVKAPDYKRWEPAFEDRLSSYLRGKAWHLGPDDKVFSPYRMIAAND